MRRIVTGVNAEGQSCVVEAAAVTTAAVSGADYLTMAPLYLSESSPPPRAPDQTGEFIDVRLAPGLVRCALFDHLPRDHVHAGAASATMHHTAAVNLMLVLAGSTRLVLQADEVELKPGDFVIVPGVDHAFVNGADGCRMVGISIGSAPADSARVDNH